MTLKFGDIVDGKRKIRVQDKWRELDGFSTGVVIKDLGEGSALVALKERGYGDKTNLIYDTLDNVQKSNTPVTPDVYEMAKEHPERMEVSPDSTVAKVMADVIYDSATKT